MPPAGIDISGEPARARRSLGAGVAALRWAAYAWMLLANAVEGRYDRPAIAVALLIGAGVWTAVMSVGRVRRATAVLAFDLAFSVAIIVLSGVVVPDQTVMGERLFFAATYPIGTALSWGAARGPWGGIASSVVMGVALVASRPANGFPVGELTGGDYGLIANGMVAYLLAGIAGGVTSAVLERWAVDARTLIDQAVRERERAARFAEREALAREIHDSVLQSLALVDKRGKELAARADVDPAEVAALARIAREEEQRVRALILRPPDEAPAGTASLRELLEDVARGAEVPASVSAVGALHLPGVIASEVAAAVAQAVRNVDQHARAARVTIFAARDGDALTVTVRDDGRGFTYDEAALEAAGKAGMLRSMKGRIEDLGGTMRVSSAAGGGTEVEFEVPIAPAPPGGD